jgi:hypothetical protein
MISLGRSISSVVCQDHWRCVTYCHLIINSLMMEAVRTSETSVDNYFTRQYIPEDNSSFSYFSPLLICKRLTNPWHIEEINFKPIRTTYLFLRIFKTREKILIRQWLVHSAGRMKHYHRQTASQIKFSLLLPTCTRNAVICLSGVKHLSPEEFNGVNETWEEIVLLVRESARAVHWSCVTPSTVAADTIWRSSLKWSKSQKCENADNESIPNNNCTFFKQGCETWSLTPMGCKEVDFSVDGRRTQVQVPTALHPRTATLSKRQIPSGVSLHWRPQTGDPY